METFTIVRSKWLRGEGPDASLLLRKTDGTMCCLGQIAEELGVPRKALLHCKSPWSIVADIRADSGNTLGYATVVTDYLRLFTYAKKPDDIRDTPFAQAAMRYNDRIRLSDWEREYALTELFALHNIQLNFVD